MFSPISPLKDRHSTRWQCAVAWMMTAVLLSGVVSPVLAKSRILEGGAQLGTAATAKYTLPSGLVQSATSNVVITKIQNVFSLALEGDTTISGVNKFHNRIRNTGNVAIKEVTLTASDFLNVSQYTVWSEGKETILTAASPSFTLALSDTGLEPEELFSFEATILQVASDKAAHVSLTVSGPENASAKLIQEYDPAIGTFAIRPIEKKIDIARGGLDTKDFVYLFDIDTKDASTTYMGMTVDLSGEALKGLSFDKKNGYQVSIHNGDNVWEALEPGTVRPWGEGYKAKLTQVDDQKFFLALEFPANAKTDKAQLRFVVLADDTAALGSRILQAETGKIADMSATGLGADSAKTPPINVNVTGILRRELGLSLPVGESGDHAAVPGQIVSLKALIENTGESEDTFVLSSESADLPKETKLVWITGTPNDDKDAPAITLAAGKNQVIELQVQLAPSNTEDAVSVMAAIAHKITIKATPENNKDEALTKKVSYTLALGDRTVSLVGIAGTNEERIVNHVVVANDSSTTFKIRVKNTTEVASHEAYIVGVKESAGLGVRLYPADAGGICGPDAGSLSSFDTGLISGGTDKDLCAQVSGSATNGGLGNRTKAGIVLEVVSKIEHNGKTKAELPLNLYVAQSETIQDQTPTKVIEPNGVVSFYHEILNTSDIKLTITKSDLVTKMESGWTVTATLVDVDGEPLPAQSIELESKEKVRIQLTITAPANVPTTETASILTVNGQFQYTAVTRLLGENTYKLIGIFDGKLVKEQALDASCDSLPDGKLFGQSEIIAKPAACIWYRLTLENTSGVDYADLAITDTAPMHSVVSTDAPNQPTLTLIAKDGAETPATAPAVANGRVDGHLDALENQQKAVLKYRVKIDGLL